MNDRPRTRGAQIRSVAGRSLWAVGVLAMVAGVAGYGQLRPPPDPAPVPPLLLDVPAPGTVLVCPGAVRLPTDPGDDDDVAYDPAFDAAPVESVVSLGVLSARPSTEITTSGVTLESIDATVIDRLGSTASADGRVVVGQDTAVVLRADAVGEVPAWLGGAAQAITSDGDLRGLAAATCQYPAAESWLVGGSTELGSSARLVLQNPGATPASVTVRLWGPTGPVELAGAPEYLVPPRSERVVLLEGVAAEQPRIVVRASASGGLITAYLQDSLLRGFVPGGVDHVAAGRAPATRQVVPLSVTESDVASAEVAVLRLLAPGEEGGTVDVTFLGADGPVDLPGTTRVVVDAGTVLDVPLGGLPVGGYVAVVDADVPVVAGAMLIRGADVGGSEPSTVPIDRAWASSIAVGRAGPLALTAGAEGELLLAAVPDDETTRAVSVTVEAIGADGVVLGTAEHLVRSGSTLALALADLAEGGAEGDDAPRGDLVGVVVRSEDPRLAWSVVLLTPDEEMVAVLSPVPPRPVQPQLAVRVR